MKEEETVDIDELLIGYLELSQDLIFKKIPEETMRKAVIFAVNTGKQMAEYVVKKFDTKDPKIIAKKLGVRVIFSDENNIVCKNLTLRSEYSPDPPTILVYTKSLAQLKEFVIKKRLETFFSPESIDAVHVAHELFHHIEHVWIGFVGRVFKVETIKIGPFLFKSEIRKLSDVAAHSFSKDLLGLKVSPKLLDYLVLDR